MTRPSRILQARRRFPSAHRQARDPSDSIVRTALIEVELNAGSEALIQPFVYRYTQKLGSPYSLTDALTRVVAAGVPAARSAAGSSRDQGVQRLAGLDDLLETFERHCIQGKARTWTTHT